MFGPQTAIGKLQMKILEDKQPHEDGWLPTLLAILVLMILPIAVLVFIAIIDRKGEVPEAEKGQLRRSEMWERFRETEPSEPEQKISEMGRQIMLAFDPPSGYTGPGQKASEMGKLIEEAIDPTVDYAGTVRKRKLSMVEV